MLAEEGYDGQKTEPSRVISLDQVSAANLKRPQLLLSRINSAELIGSEVTYSPAITLYREMPSPHQGQNRKDNVCSLE